MNYQELPKIKDSISYIYIEHSVIEQADSAVVAISKEGKIPIPVASLTCLLLGPGISITHAAVRTLCANGCMAIWCGEKMGRFYASGIGETGSAANLLSQAAACMDEERHLEAAKRMYALRFPGMNTADLTLQQLRGMEGIRMKKAYALAAKNNGVKWQKRSYDKKDWDASDPVNRALSEGNALLYGLCHAAVISLGYSPGLGFIHTGKQLSFVYDIADLYKAETTIPAAFEAAGCCKQTGADGLERETRIRCRKYFNQCRILSRIADDIAFILKSDEEKSPQNLEETGELWELGNDSIAGGINYSGGKA